VTTKAKSRELVLTTQRLICLKHSNRVSDGVTVKTELHLGAEKHKDREFDGPLGVELKGEHEFIVTTVSSLALFFTRN
jgi:hypothetical protein